MHMGTGRGEPTASGSWRSRVCAGVDFLGTKVVPTKADESMAFGNFKERLPAFGFSLIRFFEFPVPAKIVPCYAFSNSLFGFLGNSVKNPK